MFAICKPLDRTICYSYSVHIANLDDITGEVVDEGEPIVSFEEDYSMWQIQRMTITAPEAYKLIFVGTASKRTS